MTDDSDRVTGQPGQGEACRARAALVREVLEAIGKLALAKVVGASADWNRASLSRLPAVAPVPSGLAGEQA